MFNLYPLHKKHFFGYERGLLRGVGGARGSGGLLRAVGGKRVAAKTANSAPRDRLRVRDVLINYRPATLQKALLGLVGFFI